MFSVPFEVEKSITINKSLDEVFTTISDFSTWSRWSPWLCQEPSCPVTIDGAAGAPNHSQAWNGDFIGSGKMEITKVEPNASIDYDLHFLKPWKSESKVGFRFASDGDSTKITWTMSGSLPFFMFFMKKMMTAFVGSDYDRGLKMLKEYLETGSVETLTEVKGVVDREALYYVGKKRVCNLSEMGPAMQEEFGALCGLLDRSALPEPKLMLSVYHKMDMVAGTFEYTSAMGFDSKPEPVDGFTIGELAAHRAVKVAHTGPYRHLGNAWSAAVGYARSKQKMNKALPMYEIYLNNPQEVEEKDLKVEIHVPVK